jgi:adenosine kinase
VPITDFEVPLDTLRYIRDNSDALIVFDAHGPTTGCSRHGTRYPKFWIDRDRWLPHIDLLKMNIDEARSCWFEGDLLLADLDENAAPTLDELRPLAQHCLDQGVSGLYVTLDQHGCAVYCKDAAGHLREHLVSPVRIDEVVDTTGCGDSFAAGMTLGYLVTGDHRDAARFGNYAGAMRSSSIELDVYGTFDDALTRIADEYRD